MIKKIQVILLSGLLLLSATACDIMSVNEIDDLSRIEGDVPTDKNDQSQLVTDYESIKVQLEDILAGNYTWEEFRYQYPNCRKVDEYVEGKHSDFRVVCKEFPETFFCFSLVVGENGYSKMQLNAISAKLDILLPSYVGRSFDDIIAIEGDCAGFTYADALYQERYGYQYDTLHIYRDDFFYETTAYLQQGNILQEDRIVMRRYSNDNLCPWDKGVDLTIDSNTTLAKNIEKIIATRCSLETFQRNYPNAEIIEETEASITIMTAEFPQVKFVFEKAIDVWIGFERTVLEAAIVDAGKLFPKYVGMEYHELIGQGFEGENLNIQDKHYLFSYQEDSLYIIDFGMTSDAMPINEMSGDTDVYICSYSETWVRPW